MCKGLYFPQKLRPLFFEYTQMNLRSKYRYLDFNGDFKIFTHMKKVIRCLAFLAAFSIAFNMAAQSGDSYAQTLQSWRQARFDKLKAENGWLNLAGLFWLEPGVNTFGAGKEHKIRFPEGKCLARLGQFNVENGSVWIEPAPGAPLSAGKTLLTAPLQLYPSDTQTVLRSGSLRWFVIRRGERFGVRLRDLEHPALSHFTGVDCYPADTGWRVKARLEPAVDKKIPITNVLGQTTLQTSPGALVFSLGGVACRLDAVDDGGVLFILFSDQTSGVETYGTGRFLYADAPDADGYTTLDFNKAINPPCAFTTFATCPLPPPQNALPLAVRAGEKNYGHH